MIPQPLPLEKRPRAMSGEQQLQALEKEYLDGLDEHQKFVMRVAIEKLGSSFCIVKSNGFKKWLSKREQETIQPQVELSQQIVVPEVPFSASVSLAATKTTKKVKRVKKKAKSPTISPDAIAAAPVPTAMQIIHTLASTSQWTSVLVDCPDYFIVTPTRLAGLQQSPSLYCIFTNDRLLFVGTTSDTRKNFILALKGCKKHQENAHLVPAIDFALTGKPQDFTGDNILGFVITIDENKIRVRLRDAIKKELPP